MPRLDGSGPWGMGPGTGWGMGPCCGGGVWRRGMGAGFGSRRFYTKKEEQEDVENEIKAAEEDLQALKERLEELKLQGK